MISFMLKSRSSFILCDNGWYEDSSISLIRVVTMCSVLFYAAVSPVKTEFFRRMLLTQEVSQDYLWLLGDNNDLLCFFLLLFSAIDLKIIRKIIALLKFRVSYQNIDKRLMYSTIWNLSNKLLSLTISVLH
jgi:hypothetical protein